MAFFRAASSTDNVPSLFTVIPMDARASELFSARDANSPVGEEPAASSWTALLKAETKFVMSVSRVDASGVDDLLNMDVVFEAFKAIAALFRFSNEMLEVWVIAEFFTFKSDVRRLPIEFESDVLFDDEVLSEESRVWLRNNLL